VPRSTTAKSGEKGSRRKPKLGQNFLVDAGVARRIVEALGDVSNRTVIEIGPGEGVLTDLLVNRAKHVIGVELDRVLAAQLRMRYATRTNVEILESDFVTVEFPSMLGRRPGPLHDLRPTKAETVDLVGNIPYYVTSDIVLRILALHRNIERAVVMVQREVADRVSAPPGSRDYGLLSATAQLYARVENLFTVPPQAFNPPPDVYSAVLRLTMAPRVGELGIDEDSFIRLLKLAFAQKRKTLANNLKGAYSAASIKAGLKAAGLQPDVRAEAVPLEKMATLSRSLQAA